MESPAVKAGKFRMPTPLGIATAILGLLGWFLGWRFGWREFMFLAAGCLTLLVVAILLTFGRTEISVDLQLHPKRVTVGQKAVVEVNVRNAGSRRMLPVRLEVPVGLNRARVGVPSLRAGAEWSQDIVLPTSKRDVYKVGPVKSVRSDPLNLIRREVEWTGTEELFVHPITTPLARLSSGWLRDLEGQSTQDISESDLNFHTLRDYVQGDDRRHIHWRSSARLGRWVVRQFVDTRKSHLAILLGTNPADYGDADEFELAISIAASVGLRAFSDGQSVSFISGFDEAPAVTGQGFLDFCSRIQLGDSLLEFREMAARSKRILGKASVLVAISGSGVSSEKIVSGAEIAVSDAFRVCVRAVLGKPSRFMKTEGQVLSEVAALEDFAQVIWAVRG